MSRAETYDYYRRIRFILCFRLEARVSSGRFGRRRIVSPCPVACVAAPTGYLWGGSGGVEAGGKSSSAWATKQRFGSAPSALAFPTVQIGP